MEFSILAKKSSFFLELYSFDLQKIKFQQFWNYIFWTWNLPYLQNKIKFRKNRNYIFWTWFFLSEKNKVPIFLEIYFLNMECSLLAKIKFKKIGNYIFRHAKNKVPNFLELYFLNVEFSILAKKKFQKIWNYIFLKCKFRYLQRKSSNKWNFLFSALSTLKLWFPTGNLKQIIKETGFLCGKVPRDKNQTIGITPWQYVQIAASQTCKMIYLSVCWNTMLNPHSAIIYGTSGR